MYKQRKRGRKKQWYPFFRFLKLKLRTNKLRNEQLYQAEIIRILTKISDINDHYPELYKYLGEMPELPDPDSKKVRITDLVRYHSSLLELINKYQLTRKHLPQS